MSEHLRRMKKYTPRTAQHSQDLKKQALSDLEHLLNMDLGSYLVLNEEGNIQQIHDAKQKAKGDLLKHADEMKKLAQEIGEDIPLFVADFIKSADDLLHTSEKWIDPSLINQYYKTTEQLEKKLHSKRKAQ